MHMNLVLQDLMGCRHHEDQHGRRRNRNGMDIVNRVLSDSTFCRRFILRGMYEYTFSPLSDYSNKPLYLHVYILFNTYTLFQMKTSWYIRYIRLWKEHVFACLHLIQLKPITSKTVGWFSRCLLDFCLVIDSNCFFWGKSILVVSPQNIKKA